MGTTIQPSAGLASPLKAPPPVRTWDGKHGSPDGFDTDRIQLVRQRWEVQTPALLRRDRMIEENIRMLSGRQWDVWSPVMGSFVDPTRYMSDSERRWRQRPVVNLLQYWFLLTHARVTETPPIITFQPATADRTDAMLAEVMDTVFKTLWLGDLDMDDVVLRAAAWLIAAGETYFETCAEYDANGVRYLMQAPATLSMQREDGSTIERDTGEPVPYDVQGNPMASLVPQGDDYGYQVSDYDAPDYQGQSPAYVNEGCPKVNIYSPLEVRAEWGSNIPWNDKQWIIIRRYLTPEKVKAIWGLDVVPDTAGSAGDVTGGAGVLQNMLFGAGNFQAVGNNVFGQGNDRSAAQAYVTVDTMWEKPTADTAADSDPNFPAGGRLLIVTPTVVLHDSLRPYRTTAAGPIRRAQFVQMPGRAGFGSTPLEQMVPLQKTYNRGWAQILEHRNRCTNPILIYDADSGIGDVATNMPGQNIPADFSVNGQPAYYLSPPPLSGDVWKTQSMLFDLLMRLGSIAGSEGSAPTEDPSGELIAQLRFNSDRPVSIAVRSLAYALAGVADDLIAVLPTCWPAEKTIAYAGDDNVLRTITVQPEMWEQGHVNARPDIVSAVPESQPARQARLERWFAAGILGNPADPATSEKFLSIANFPDMNRVARLNGGVDRITCERFLTQLAQGGQAQQIPLIPQYNYPLMLKTTRDHMASPEFLSYDPAVQQQFEMFYQLLLTAQAQAAQLAAAAAAPVMATGAALQGHMASIAQANGPMPMVPPSQSMTQGGPMATGPQPGEPQPAAA